MTAIMGTMSEPVRGKSAVGFPSALLAFLSFEGCLSFGLASPPPGWSSGFVSRSFRPSNAVLRSVAASQAEITESLITDSDGVRKVYNSAAIAFPDGHTDSYQKMHRAGSEETAWSLPGSTPVMFEMPEWTGSDGKPLKAGIDIC